MNIDNDNTNITDNDFGNYDCNMFVTDNNCDNNCDNDNNDKLIITYDYNTHTCIC